MNVNWKIWRACQNRERQRPDQANRSLNFQHRLLIRLIRSLPLAVLTQRLLTISFAQTRERDKKETLPKHRASFDRRELFAWRHRAADGRPRCKLTDPFHRARRTQRSARANVRAEFQGQDLTRFLWALLNRRRGQTSHSRGDVDRHLRHPAPNFARPIPETGHLHPGSRRALICRPARASRFPHPRSRRAL
jgi:hypothetical protein